MPVFVSWAGLCLDGGGFAAVSQQPTEAQKAGSEVRGSRFLSLNLSGHALAFGVSSVQSALTHGLSNSPYRFQGVL